MEITVTELGPCRKKVAFVVPVDRVNEEYSKGYREIADGVVIPGFRKGRVPRAVLRRRFGQRVAQQVKAVLLQAMFKSMIDDHEIDPVRDPDLDIELILVREEQPFDLEIEVEVKPDFEIGEYKGLTVEQPDIQLDEARVDELIERARRQHAEQAPVDGEPIQLGDHLVCDLVFEVEGETEPRKLENVPVLVREGVTIAYIGLTSEPFIGQVSGAQLSGSAVFSDRVKAVADRGKPLKYTITINAHKRLELPALDQDFFSLLECANLEELRERMRQQLEDERRFETERRIEDALVDQLVARATFEIPPSVLDHERERLRRSTDLELRNEQPELSDAEREAKIEETMAASDEQITRRIRGTYILEKIARLEKLEVSEAEVEERIKLMAQAHGIWPNQMRQILEQRQMIDTIYSELVLTKVRRFVFEHAAIAGKA